MTDTLTSKGSRVDCQTSHLYDDFKYQRKNHMKQKIPHPIPYQGSKRNLANDIMVNVSQPHHTLFEPFAGSAAISLYCAYHNLADRFVIGDSLIELVELWKLIVNNPEKVADEYNHIWEGFEDGDPEYFFQIRERFNSDRNPVDLLYLIARCVKNAVRFGKNGNFTQSADKRRKGTRPARMRENLVAASFLLKGKTEFFAGDFSDCLVDANEKDLVYMDPPYQGTSYGRDKRYHQQVTREDLCTVLAELNDRNVPFLLSYDGYTGEKSYGEELPNDLELKRLYLTAGRSSQATLSGKNAITVESLYVSKKIKLPSSESEKILVADSCNEEKRVSVA
jgi:DNA adenine methylase